jgi:hypothetical protein
MSGNTIYDPCFSLPQLEKVVCPNNLYDKNDDIVLNLTQPFPEPDPQTDIFRSDQLAWYVELLDGSHCFYVTGVTAIVGDERANYICESDDYLMGQLKEGVIWTAKKAILSEPDSQTGDFTIISSREVNIKKVWQ